MHNLYNRGENHSLKKWNISCLSLLYLLNFNLLSHLGNIYWEPILFAGHCIRNTKMSKRMILTVYSPNNRAWKKHEAKTDCAKKRNRQARSWSWEPWHAFLSKWGDWTENQQRRSRPEHEGPTGPAVYTEHSPTAEHTLSQAHKTCPRTDCKPWPQRPFASQGGCGLPDIWGRPGSPSAPAWENIVTTIIVTNSDWVRTATVSQGVKLIKHNLSLHQTTTSWDQSQGSPWHEAEQNKTWEKRCVIWGQITSWNMAVHIRG